jgi:peptidoglycan endopeptidase LytE
VKRTLKNLSKAVLFSLCSATALGFVGAPGAMAAPAVSASKGFTYAVKPGDSLIGIARRVNVSLDELLQVNGFVKSSVIHPGRTIKLPDNAVVQSGAPVTGASAPTTYLVKSGDSLIGIARRSGVTLEQLLDVNGFVKSSVIHPGRTIKLPAGATMPQATAVLATSISATSSTSSAAPQAPAATPASGGELPTYTIQAGDSLTRIASKAQVSLEDLLKVNGFTKSTVIHPKQVINLPANAATPSTRVQSMIAFAVSQTGKPYQFGAAGPNSFDCSGLVRAAFSNIGVKVPHQSQALAALGTPVDWRNSSIQPGDLVFTANSSSGGRIGHVAIAISATEVVEALSAGKPVGISRMPAKERILEVRRIL